MTTVGFLCMVRGDIDVAPFVDRVDALRDHWSFDTHIVWADNGGRALAELRSYAGFEDPAATGPDRWMQARSMPTLGITLVTLACGCPMFPSHEVSPERWAHFVHLANAGLEQMPDVDALVVVHPDIEWNPEHVAWAVDQVLIAQRNRWQMHGIALPVLTPDGRYYDTWGTVRPPDPSCTGEVAS